MGKFESPHGYLFEFQKVSKLLFWVWFYGSIFFIVSGIVVELVEMPRFLFLTAFSKQKDFPA